MNSWYFFDGGAVTEQQMKKFKEEAEKQLEEITKTRELHFMLSLSIGYYSTVLCYQTQIGLLLSNADSLMYEDKDKRRKSVSENDILLRKDKKT